MTTSIAKLSRFILASSLFAVLYAPAFASAFDEAQSAPTVCIDGNQQIKKGEIDVLVVLDNSGSLDTTVKGSKPTDPDGKRFDALREFIDNYSKLGSSGKNFGLISFAGSANPIIPISPLSSDASDQVEDKIRSGVGEAKGPTNYILAFDLALKEFNKRPSENCKILIWFTDGAFNTSDRIEDGRIQENIDKDLRDLENSFCGENGFATSIRSSLINTFVVFLGDGKDSEVQARIDASIDAMQAVTGDMTPSIQGGSVRQVDGSQCKQNFDPVNGHLGEVVSASEAKDLVGYLTDIVNIADGGKKVTSEECPVQSQTLESLPMPSGWFIDWISITSWDGDLPSAESLEFEIKMNGSSMPFSDFFEQVNDQESTNVLRFSIKDGKQGDLKPGWVLKSTENGRACVRAKPADVKFRIVETQRIPINPSIPEEFNDLFEGDVLKCYLNGFEAPCSSEAGQGLMGKIKLQNGEVFSEDGTLPVLIEISDLPSLIDNRCVIKLTGDVQVSEGLLATTVCGVVPAPEAPVRVIATSLLLGLQRCGLGTWHVTVDGLKTDQIQGGKNKVFIGIESDTAPQNKNQKCVVENTSLTFEFATPNGAEMPVVLSEIDFNLIKKTNPLLAILFSLIATAFVSLLSLLLLRAVNMLTSKTVRAQDFFGYETTVDFVPGQFQRGELVIPGGSARSFIADIDQMLNVSGNQNQTSLKFASIDLVRKLPSFLTPFDESRLVLQSKANAVFWKANRAGDGLNMAFSKAVILSTNEKQPPTADRPAKVVISVVVPKRGFGSGIEGVQQIIREHGDELAVGLFKVLNSEQELFSSKGISPNSASNDVGRQAKSIGEVSLVPTDKPASKPLSPSGGMGSPPRPPEPPRRSN
jgi:hypothetical protein